MKTIAIDFDGTITHQIPYKPYTYGKVNKRTRARLQSLWVQQWRIIVWTSRSWAERSHIKEYLEDIDVPYTEVHCCKIIADVYCDTKSKRPEELP